MVSYGRSKVLETIADECPFSRYFSLRCDNTYAWAGSERNFVQSERSSLVSGAAVGMQVAASLAPPAGLVGMAIAIGRWDIPHLSLSED